MTQTEVTVAGSGAPNVLRDLNSHLAKLPTCRLILGEVGDGHGYESGVHCLAPKELHKRAENLELGCHELDDFVAAKSGREREQRKYLR
jgi:hypothetical protein